jgi:peptide/nickel transport system permease protein
VGAYIARRLLAALAVLIGISIFVFGSLHVIPGDPIMILAPDESARLTKSAVEEFRREHGLDQPLAVQYLRYMQGVVRLDFGKSIRTGQPIGGEFAKRLPATVQLGIAGLLISVAIGIGAGVVAAVKRGSLLDRIIQPLAFFGVSIPSFWQGILLILLFAVLLRWLPPSGWGDGIFAPGGWRYLILPALTLGTGGAALLVRMVRTSMLDVLNQDYVRTARAKGIVERGVVYRHALRNAMIPVVTLIGLRIGDLIGGSVIIETVFAWPGVGRYMIQAIGVRDFPVVQSVTLLLAISYVLANLLVDVAYGYFDPRIRFD